MDSEFSMEFVSSEEDSNKFGFRQFLWGFYSGEFQVSFDLGIPNYPWENLENIMNTVGNSIKKIQENPKINQQNFHNSH